MEKKNRIKNNSIGTYVNKYTTFGLQNFIEILLFTNISLFLKCTVRESIHQFFFFLKDDNLLQKSQRENSLIVVFKFIVYIELRGKVKTLVGAFVPTPLCINLSLYVCARV